MAGVVGVVGRPEHPGLLVEDAGPVVVLPQLGLHQDAGDVVIPGQDVERRAVAGLGVERAGSAQLGVVVERLEPAGRLDVRSAARWSSSPVRPRRQSGQWVAEATPSGP